VRKLRSSTIKRGIKYGQHLDADDGALWLPASFRRGRRTKFLGQEMEMRKFNVMLPTADTEGDWEEMPWLAGHGAGLIHDTRPATDVIETMMAEARAILKRLSASL
jgi:NAD(P)H-dependent flavin oxidoreductase YrpB (nitropropane dioxygenase family)